MDYTFPKESTRCKLTRKQASEIHALLADGVAGTEIARIYGVSSVTITAIKKGEVYKGTKKKPRVKKVCSVTIEVRSRRWAVMALDTHGDEVYRVYGHETYSEALATVKKLKLKHKVKVK